jgi:predicted MFS family arabinose efflux permease
MARREETSEHDPSALGADPHPRVAALRFVLMIGVVSLFADFTYEGSRAVVGPYLARLGASGTVVGVVAGFGELCGYGLRLLSGRLSERTGKFWPITLVGYFIQMLSVPLLALAGSWQAAALLIIVERIGKATRNPPRDVMLSHAGNVIGQGWVFGLHEALDQCGALLGPLAVAAVLARRGDYKTAFAMLLIPALIALALLLVARRVYPQPGHLEGQPADLHAQGLPRQFWVYLAGAALVSAGFPDFAMLSFHFAKTSAVSAEWVPVFYALAMGSSGLGSLLFGRAFDRRGIAVLVPLTLVSAAFVPLVFLSGFWAALVGCALWGLGMGVHESIIPAAVARMVPPQRRASAYGLFTAAYGIAWFLGSAAIGLLYDVSLAGLVGFSLIVELAAIPFFLLLTRQMGERT